VKLRGAAWQAEERLPVARTGGGEFVWLPV